MRKEVINRIIKYLVVLLLTFGIGNYLLKQAFDYKQLKLAKEEIALADNLQVKQLYFKNNKEKYNTIFIGDSRTFCAFDPILLDSLIDSRSVNLAHWAFWMPSQYAYFKDILPFIDTSTTVVWSVGVQNFFNIERLNDIYPLSFSSYIDLLRHGHSVNSISPNLLRNSSVLFSLSIRERVMTLGKGLMEREMISKNMSRQLGNKTDITNDQSKKISWPKEIIENEYYHNDLFDRNGKMVSIESFRRGGNYLRVEIDSLYYRFKQSKTGGIFSGHEALAINEAYVRTFIEILKLFKAKNIKLIVNEMEEAPYKYGDPEALEKHRSFMRAMKDEVESNGFEYIRVDFDQFNDGHYFDYNHLNYKGVKLFSQLFSEEYQQLVKPDVAD